MPFIDTFLTIYLRINPSQCQLEEAYFSSGDVLATPTHDSSLVHSHVFFVLCARHQKCKVLISSY